MKQIKNRVLAVGGGSAGHVAPVLAIIDELAARAPSLEVRFWCNRGFMRQSRALMKSARIEVKVEKIFAGKIRRYYGTSIWRQLADIPTVLHNIGDILAIVTGFIQSFIKLVIWRPQVVFCKGGFVCLPVGYAAAVLRIPIVLHDSDAHPGLTNRLLARWARFIATGAPLEYYAYPPSKATYVGIPTRPEFRAYTDAEKAHAKGLFHLPEDKPLVVVSGGSLGAKKINDAMVAIAPELIKHTSVVHIAGIRQYEELKEKVPSASNYKLFDFLSDHLARLLGSADIVVTRAGASAMAEMAAVEASVIIVPNAMLVGGHQLKNAKVFTDAEAVVIVNEATLQNDPASLLKEILDLLDNPLKRRELRTRLSQFAKPMAAKDMADLIEEASK